MTFFIEDYEMTRTTRTSIRAFLLVHLLIPFALLVHPGVTSASSTLEIQAPIAQQGSRLDDLTFSSVSTIYAIDSSRNQILFLAADNQIVRKIAMAMPTAIAAGDSVLYVGSSKDLSVTIMDLSGQITGHLGEGAHEFKLPRNIAIDRETNNVYVVDQLDDSVKVYAKDGTFLRRIDDAGNLPQDVTVNGEEIFVLDQPLLTDSYGDQIRGARVSVFDVTGTLVRSFGAYGTNDGEFVRPKAITSDAQGFIYIADAFNGSVVCFDQQGNFQQSIQDTTHAMIGSMGLAIDQTGRRLASTSLVGQLSVYLIDSTR
jgi:DNA-binding beta-propeller fold protein YncE